MSEDRKPPVSSFASRGVYLVLALLMTAFAVGPIGCYKFLSLLFEQSLRFQT